MRRIVLILLPLIFLLSSCAQPGLKAEDIVFSFQCKADVTWNGQKTACAFSRSAPGIASVQLLSGDLSGLTYFWSGQDFSVSYGDLTSKSDECVLPPTSFASILQQAVDSAATDGVLTKTHGDEFSGSAPGFDFTVTVNEKTCTMQKIDIPRYGLTAELYDYSELGL